jgi:hypothetical protein
MVTERRDLRFKRGDTIAEAWLFPGQTVAAWSTEHLVGPANPEPASPK